MQNKLTKKIKAFSLIETLVTLAVFGILLAMLSEILVLNLQVSRKITARSTIRADLAEMTGLMQRDMRNANHIYISNCGDENDDDFELKLDNESFTVGCQMEHFKVIKWVLSNDDTNSLCPPHEFEGNNIPTICRLDENNNILYQSSKHIKIESFDIDVNFVEEYTSESGERKGTDAIIYFTVISSATNDYWNINNLFRQVIVTTRNY